MEVCPAEIDVALSLNSIFSDKVVATNGSRLYLWEKQKPGFVSYPWEKKKQHPISPTLEPGELIKVVQVELDIFCIGTNCGRLYWQFDQDHDWQSYEASDHRPIDWIRLALPYVTLGIGRDVHALSLSRSHRASLGIYSPPKNVALAASRYLGGADLRGSRVDVAIYEDGKLGCWYGMGAQSFRCNVTDCSRIFDITSNGTLLVRRKSGVLTMVQAISCRSVPIPQLCDTDISNIAVVEADDALVLVTLHAHSLSVWTYFDSNWHKEVIPIESTTESSSGGIHVHAAAFKSRIFIYWLQEGVMAMISATINEKASRPPELYPHDPIMSAASSINEVVVPTRSLLEQGGTLFPLYGDRVLNPDIRERNIRLLGQGLLPCEGWLPTPPPDIKPLQILIPSVDDSRTIESFVKRMQAVPRCDAICVIRQHPTLDARTNLEKQPDEVRLLENYDFFPMAENDQSQSRGLRSRYDPLIRMRRHGYCGDPPQWDVSILSFSEDPEAIFERSLRPPMKYAAPQQHSGISDEEIQSRRDRAGGKRVEKRGQTLSDKSGAARPVKHRSGQSRTKLKSEGSQGTRNKSEPDPQEVDKENIDEEEDSEDEQEDFDDEQGGSDNEQGGSDDEPEVSDDQEVSKDEYEVVDMKRRQGRAREKSAVRLEQPNQKSTLDTGKGKPRQRERTARLDRSSDVGGQEMSVPKAKIGTKEKMESPVGAIKPREQREHGRYHQKKPSGKPFAAPVRTFTARAQPVRQNESRRQLPSSHRNAR